VHGDSPNAVEMASHVRRALVAAGVTVQSFAAKAA
jgi:lactam utilization protein B